MVKTRQHPDSQTMPYHTGPLRGSSHGGPRWRLAAGLVSSLLGLLQMNACAVRSSLDSATPSIAGQSQTVKDLTPAIMLLVKDPDSNSLDLICSAVLIHAELALTAAHCVVDGEDTLPHTSGAKLPLTPGLVFGFANRVSDIASRAGLRNPLITPAQDGIAIPPKSQFVNPNFSNLERMQHGTGDIALVKLATPAPKGYPVAKLPQVSLSRDSKGNALKTLTLTLLGFGATERGQPDGGILRQGDLQIIKSDNVGSFWVGDLSDDKQTAPCPGDSGGGLFAQLREKKQFGYTLVGLASLIVTTQNCSNTSALVTDVGYYTQWIQETADKRFSIQNL